MPLILASFSLGNYCIYPYAVWGENKMKQQLVHGRKRGKDGSIFGLGVDPPQMLNRAI